MADPVAKKRKTEWMAGCKKLEGDTSFVKDCFVTNVSFVNITPL